MKPYFAFQWHITDTCDQRCEHCYIFAGNEGLALKETSFEQMQAVLDNCKEMCEQLSRTPYFYITGGDPILHKDFWRLLELLKKDNIDFAILGNPFHLTDEVCKKLKDYGCRKYQLSIDGMRETHDAIRKPGSFDTTIEKIKCIRAAGIDCAVMTTVSKTNADELLEIIDTVVANKVNIFAFGRYCPASSSRASHPSLPPAAKAHSLRRSSSPQRIYDSSGAPSDKSTHLTPAEYRELLDKCWQKFEQYKDSDTTFNLKDHLWTLYLYEKGLYTIPDELEKDTIYDGCNCANCHLTILPDGDVYACRRMESRVGNIFEERIGDIFTGEKMDCYRQYDKFEKCSKCELLCFCRGCPAVAYGYTHNPYAADPQCWKELDA